VKIGNPNAPLVATTSSSTASGDGGRRPPFEQLQALTGLARLENGGVGPLTWARLYP
jgi:hypothetical protein